MDKDARILVTGERGFVGRNLTDYLVALGYWNVGAANAALDYYDAALEQLQGAEYVFHCAGRVRGIAGNMADQEAAYRENVLINTNVVYACVKHKVKKLVALGTVAMYPWFENYRFYENDILKGGPPPAEYGYSMAKRGMLAHLEVSGLNWSMPICTNMYGPHDRFDIEHGHCIPALIRKFHEGNPVVWGDGSQKRDFLYVKDAVRALVMIMEKGEGAINLATGETASIKDVADQIEEISGYSCTYDETKLVGHTNRSYDVSRLRHLGFKPEYTLEQGLRETYEWYAQNHEMARK